MARLEKNLKEPSILVRPVSKFGGLDNIHIALIILVVILILLVVVISYNTTISVVNLTSGANCTYGSANGKCITPIHTAAQAKLEAEKILAGYSATNGSISILPYLADVDAANVSYMAGTRQWYASIPYTAPLGSNTYTLGILMDDPNLSTFSTFVQAAGQPPSVSMNYVAAPGVIKLADHASCGGNATQIYWFIDPYAPGSVQSLVNATRLQAAYGSRANLSVKILFTQYSQRIVNTYGLNNTLNLGKYILCGSVQKNFTGFARALNASYSGTYMPQYVLLGIASSSGFNMSSLNSCIASSQSVINAQAVQASYYNVTSPTAVVTDCQYLSIPQTAEKAACYSNNSLC